MRRHFAACAAALTGLSLAASAAAQTPLPATAPPAAGECQAVEQELSIIKADPDPYARRQRLKGWLKRHGDIASVRRTPNGGWFFRLASTGHDCNHWFDAGESAGLKPDFKDSIWFYLPPRGNLAYGQRLDYLLPDMALLRRRPDALPDKNGVFGDEDVAYVRLPGSIACRDSKTTLHLMPPDHAGDSDQLAARLDLIELVSQDARPAPATRLPASGPAAPVVASRPRVPPWVNPCDPGAPFNGR